MEYEIVQIFENDLVSRVSQTGLFSTLDEAQEGLKAMVETMIEKEHLRNINVKYSDFDLKVMLISDDVEIVGKRRYEIRPISKKDVVKLG